MTPKEKAKELIDKMSSQTYSHQLYAGAYYNVDEIGWEAGKKCAIIAVDEIMSLMIKFHNRHIEDNSNEIYFWEEVKNELNKQD